MTKISVKRFRVEGIGKPIVELVDQYDCIADSLASLYLTTKEHLSHNTVTRHAYELRFFLLWCGSNNIDIYNRIKLLGFLSELEARAFISHAKCDSNIPEFISCRKEPSDKYIDNALNQTIARTSVVSIGLSNGRLHRVADYLKFCHQELNRHKLNAFNSDRLRRVLRLLSDAIEKDLGPRQISDPKYLDQCDDFKSVLKAISLLKEDSKNSPFSELTRVRNNLIVDLIVDTGIRRASIAKLKISDIHFEGQTPKIWIAGEVSDKSDPRANKPEQKTQEHFCYPNSGVLKKLKSYIEKHRPKLVNERSGEFVFLAEKNSRFTRGDPMSLNAINYIFTRMSAYLGVRLHPHMLRHIWNLKFSELSKDSKYSSYELDKSRRILMGWTPTSEMTSVYNRPAEIERAQELVRRLQMGEL